jgi:hypothetical protein
MSHINPMNGKEYEDLDPALSDGQILFLFTFGCGILGGSLGLGLASSSEKEWVWLVSMVIGGGTFALLPLLRCWGVQKTLTFIGNGLFLILLILVCSAVGILCIALLYGLLGDGPLFNVLAGGTFLLTLSPVGYYFYRLDQREEAEKQKLIQEYPERLQEYREHQDELRKEYWRAKFAEMEEIIPGFTERNWEKMFPIEN